MNSKCTPRRADSGSQRLQNRGPASTRLLHLPYKAPSHRVDRAIFPRLAGWVEASTVRRPCLGSYRQPTFLASPEAGTSPIWKVQCPLLV